MVVSLGLSVVPNDGMAVQCFRECSRDCAGHLTVSYVSNGLVPAALEYRKTHRRLARLWTTV